MNGSVQYAVEQRTSKAGKPYNVIILHFPNGYELVQFITNEQAYIIGLNKK